MRESSIISEAQSRTLETKIVDSIRDADIFWNGINFRKKRTMVSNDVQLDSEIATYSNDTDINRVLFWLASETGDYGRNNVEKGANLKQYIGKILNDSNMTTWGTWIKDSFNDQFENSNLEIADLRLIADRNNRTLYIYFAVLNNRTKKVSTSGIAITP